MLKLKRHKFFIKELRNAQLSDQHFLKFIVYLAKLIEEEPLPDEALDHPLKGDYKDCREFHISGDVLGYLFYSRECTKSYSHRVSCSTF